MYCFQVWLTYNKKLVTVTHAGVTGEDEQRRLAYDAQVTSLKADLADLQAQLDKEKKG